MVQRLVIGQGVLGFKDLVLTEWTLVLGVILMNISNVNLQIICFFENLPTIVTIISYKERKICYFKF